MQELALIHSVVRYGVLAAGAVAFAVTLFVLLTGDDSYRAIRAVGAAFVGLLDLQVALGIALVAGGIWFPALIGHVVMMVAAAVALHVALAMNRRRPYPGALLPLLGSALALALIVGGIFALGRPALSGG